jgi:hypothetical protein
MISLKRLATTSLAAIMFPALHAQTRCPENVASILPRFVERSIIIVPVMLNGSAPMTLCWIPPRRLQPSIQRWPPTCPLSCKARPG